MRSLPRTPKFSSGTFALRPSSTSGTTAVGSSSPPTRHAHGGSQRPKAQKDNKSETRDNESDRSARRAGSVAHWLVRSLFVNKQEKRCYPLGSGLPSGQNDHLRYPLFHFCYPSEPLFWRPARYGVARNPQRSLRHLCPRIAVVLTLLWRRLRADPRAMLGLVTVIVLVLLAALAPLVARYDPTAIDLAGQLQRPSFAHWMGTDFQGRDVWARIVFGARISLTVGIMSQAIALTLGVTLGLVSGFYGRWVDEAIMRLADI